MRAASLPIVVVLLALASGRAFAAATDEPITRVSQPTEPQDLALAWREPGFRLHLRLGAEDLESLDTTPRGRGLSFAVEPAVRLTEHWAVGLTLHYTLLTPSLLGGAMTGVRWSVTAGPSWHLGGLGIAAGVGFAGQLGGWTPPASGAPFVPSSGDCDGSGAVGQLRLTYLFDVGENFATGPAVQGEFLGLKCKDLVQTSGSPTNPTSQTIALLPWWQQSVAAAWTLAWR